MGKNTSNKPEQTDKGKQKRSYTRKPTAPNGTDTRPLRVKNKRAEENKAIRREALREELQAREYLRQIDIVDKELEEINAKVKAVKLSATIKNPVLLRNDYTRKKFELEKADVRLKALKLKADNNFKRLNKVLPDLKAVEMSDPNGNSPFSSFVDAVRDLTKEATLIGIEMDIDDNDDE